MIHLFLKPILVARGIDRPYSYLVNAGFSPADARELLNSDISNFTIAQIHKICEALQCSPDELLRSSGKIVNMTDTGLLDALKRSSKTSNWLHNLKESSLQELSKLKEVVKTYKNKLV
jgi:DNA-binding Xre family transcriptional regulator